MANQLQTVKTLLTEYGFSRATETTSGYQLELNGRTVKVTHKQLGSDPEKIAQDSRQALQQYQYILKPYGNAEITEAGLIFKAARKGAVIQEEAPVEPVVEDVPIK